jgi:hypothetical protein
LHFSSGRPCGYHDLPSSNYPDCGNKGGISFFVLEIRYIRNHIKIR